MSASRAQHFVLALAVLIFCCLLAVPARAEVAVKVLVLEPVAPEMLERVQGQLSDKTASVLAVTAPGKTAVERAFHAAQKHAAALVVWFSSERGLSVNVLDVRRSRLVEREVPAPRSGEVMARSAREEAAAFIVRGAVEDIIEGRGVGRVVVAPSPEPPPCPPARSAPEAAARLRALGGVYALGDGLALLHGPELGALLDAGPFILGASARISFASTVERAGFSLDVARYDLRLLGAYRLLARPFVELSAGLQLGPSLVSRTTRAVPAGYVTAPSSSRPDLTLGILGASSFRLTKRGARLRAALGLEAGIADRDLLVRGRPEPLDSAWPVQPFAELSLLLPLL